MRMGDSHLWIRIGIIIFLVICDFVPKINGAGSFELEILEISNDKNHLIDGYCCGSNEKEKSKTVDCPKCTTAFRLCLKESSGGAESLGCPFGESTTKILGTSSFRLDGQRFANITVPFSFRWTQSFSLILQALDMYRNSNSSSPAIIEEVAYSGTISPPSDWLILDNRKQMNRNALVRYKIRVICDEHYYNSTCTVLCKPRDDYFGHYTCGSRGEKVCRKGWVGENCERPICPGGCINGSCERPGVCQCRTGYKGKHCDECQPYPGCKNGFCTKPWECQCHKNWGGILCDKDLNYCGTHSPCEYGGTCHHMGGEKFRCTCPEGLSGSRCEIVEDPCATTPCMNGASCRPNKNATSTQNVNGNNFPRLHRGISSMGAPVSARTIGKKDSIALSMTTKTELDYVCTCPPGFAGERCEQNIDECKLMKPCKNGAICIDKDNDYQCECVPGFDGKDCENDIDECANNPCQNGECVNMINSFYCKCPDEFNGTLCETMMNVSPTDFCASNPCHNGGTCESSDEWFLCKCSNGFEGSDCRRNINECASDPCTEGSTCIDGIGTFTCACPPNRLGKRCEILLSNSPPKCSFKSTFYDGFNAMEANLCNSCICEHNKSRCSNLWCGLPNCITKDQQNENSEFQHECNDNEVCVAELKETCLSPPCAKRGDCRKVEHSRRTAPPKYPVSSRCWPNQAVLSENCSRISIVLDMFNVSAGLSTENYCHNLRTIVGGLMIEKNFHSPSAIIIICDIKTGTNDTIEVTISCNDESNSILPRVVGILEELLSRPKLYMKGSFLIDYPELFALNAIVEKVERAVTNESEKLMYIEREAYMLIVFIGVVLLIISSVMYTICLWHSNHSICSRQSEIDLSVTDTTRCHDEEKSNNLQNEENFRRYANPLKNSTCSLRSSSNVELSPIHDHQYAGTSNALNRSQLSIFKNPTSDSFTNTSKIVSASPTAAMMVEYEPTSKGLSSQSLYKTQNFDVDKNTIHGIESQQSSKDFDKCINKVDFKFFSAAAAAAATTTATMSSSPNHHQFSSNHHHHNHHHNSNVNNSLHKNNCNNTTAAAHQPPQQNNNNNVNSNDTLTLHI